MAMPSCITNSVAGHAAKEKGRPSHQRCGEGDLDCLGDDTSLMFSSNHLVRLEGLLQNLERGARIGSGTAQEDVERCVAALGPGVDADMTFGQPRDAAYAAARRELMQINMEQGCSCRPHRLTHRLLNVIFVGKVFTLPKVDDEVATCECHSLFVGDKVITVIRMVGGHVGPSLHNADASCLRHFMTLPLSESARGRG